MVRARFLGVGDSMCQFKAAGASFKAISSNVNNSCSLMSTGILSHLDASAPWYKVAHLIKNM